MSDDKYDMSKFLGMPSFGDLEKAADYVNNAADRIDLIAPKAKQHIVSMCIAKDLHEKPRYQSITTGNFVAPTCSNVEYVISKIIEKGYKKAEISELVGVSPTKNRTIDRWSRGGDVESTIPYAAWRLLCAYAGFSIDLELEDNKNK